MMSCPLPPEPRRIATERHLLHRLSTLELLWAAAKELTLAFFCAINTVVFIILLFFFCLFGVSLYATYYFWFEGSL